LVCKNSPLLANDEIIFSVGYNYNKTNLSFESNEHVNAEYCHTFSAILATTNFPKINFKYLINKNKSLTVSSTLNQSECFVLFKGSSAFGSSGGIP